VEAWGLTEWVGLSGHKYRRNPEKSGDAVKLLFNFQEGRRYFIPRRSAMDRRLRGRREKAKAGWSYLYISQGDSRGATSGGERWSHWRGIREGMENSQRLFKLMPCVMFLRDQTVNGS